MGYILSSFLNQGINQLINNVSCYARLFFFFSGEGGGRQREQEREIVKSRLRAVKGAVQGHTATTAELKGKLCFV